MKRVLLIPSDHGGGRGHVSRCINLAKKLQAEGSQTAIVLEQKHYQDGIDAGIPSYLLNTKRERFLKFQLKKPFWPRIKMIERVERPPVFLVFNGVAYQVPRDEYLSTRIALMRFKKLVKIVEQFKPDVLIGDTHFLTFLLGKKFSMPVIQITRLAAFPPAPRFFWWLQDEPRLVEPNAIEPFAPLLEKLAVNDVRKAEDLLRGDLYLIPSSEQIEPVDGRRDDVLFCGPLTENYRGDQKIPFFDLPVDVPRIYVTAGGGANRFGQQAFFEALLKIFDRRDFKVLVSTGGLYSAKNLNGQSTNVLFVDWIDGMSAIRKSDLVIHHGGYGSMMETLSAAKPSIVIPFHSEQEGNGRRLKELQVGDLHLPYAGKLQELLFSWPFGVYSMMAGTELALDAEQIISMIDGIYDQSLYARLQKISEELLSLQKNFDALKMLESV
ncbi:glycosyltransferase [Caldithrix abyssi]